MSRDPLEELFGEIRDEPDAPAPVPARDRLAYEQAERVRTAQLPAKGRVREKDNDAATDSGSGSGGAAKLKPWILVGIVAVVALIASIVVVNLARGNDTPPVAEPTPTQQPTTPAPTPEPESDSDSDGEESDEPETEEETPDGPPEVEVGSTFAMPIGPWDATSEISQRFGSVSFAIPDGTTLILSADLLNSFPDSCAAMREGWGATKQGDSYEVHRPASTCSDAPELYDTVWGLTQAWVDTIQ